MTSAYKPPSAASIFSEATDGAASVVGDITSIAPNVVEKVTCEWNVWTYSSNQ